MNDSLLKYGLMCGCTFAGIPLMARNVPVKNVILILTDDMGPHASGLGTREIRTPNIDRLISSGITFPNAFSVCASSAPSRSSILTGMYPHSNGHWRNTHSLLLSDPDSDFAPGTEMRDLAGVYPEIPTLPEIFRDKGYYTAILRKFHLSYPWKYPFTERCNTQNTPESYYQDILSILGKAGDAPCFIMANITPPHRPWPNTAKFITENYPDAKNIELPPYLPDIPEIREEVARYYANIMYADRLIGAVLRAVEESGAASETLIVFTGDQGPAFHRAKASPYYAGSNVPFVVCGPGIERGRHSEQLVSLIDILPTVLDALRIEIPVQVQGKSLMPILTGREKRLEERSYIFTTHNSHGPSWPEFYPSRAIYDGRYYMIWNLLPSKGYTLPDDLRKNGAPWFNDSYEPLIRERARFPEHYRALVELLENRPRFELYDMENDPAQLHNLYGLPEYAETQRRLKKALADWRRQTGDTDKRLKEMEESFGKPIPFMKETQRRKQLKANK